jgi:hypothetical protein
MARFTSISGSFTGRVGGFVYYRLNGKNVARSMPGKYTDRNSIKQQNQRYGIFAPAISFSSLMKYYAPDIFIVKPTERSRYSQLVKDLFPAFGGTLDVPTVDLTIPIIGNGELPIQDFVTVVKATTSSITITWSNSLSTPAQQDSDKVRVFVTSETFDATILISPGIARSAGTATFTVPQIFAGKKVWVSTAFFLGGDSNNNDLAGKLKLAGNFGLINLA